MKHYAIHIPMSDRERKAFLKAVENSPGLTQGQYARKLMYGKLDPMAAVKRADLREHDGAWIKIKMPDMKHPLTLKNDGKARK